MSSNKYKVALSTDNPTTNGFIESLDFLVTKLTSENITSCDGIIVNKEIEKEMIANIMAANKPTFFVANAMMSLQTYFEGELNQDDSPEIINHENQHKINIVSETKLASILNHKEYIIPSDHKVIADDEPKGLIVNAITDDGLIECFEVLNNNFVFSFQWDIFNQEYPINRELWQEFTRKLHK